MVGLTRPVLWTRLLRLRVAVCHSDDRPKGIWRARRRKRSFWVRGRVRAPDVVCPDRRPPSPPPVRRRQLSPRHPFPVRPVSWFPARRLCLGSHAERCARPLGPSLPLGCSASCVAGSLAEGWWLCERTLVSGLGLAKAGASLLIGGCLGLGGEWLGFSTWRTRGSDWPPPGPSVGMPDGPAATGSSSRARLTPLGAWQLTRVLAPPAGGGGDTP